MNDYAIVADVLFDGSGREPLERIVVTISGDRIASVDTKPPRSVPVLDLGGCTLLPGLIDTHVHLALTGTTVAEVIAFAGSASERELLEVMRTNAEEALRAGLTTLRDCGAPGQSAFAARAATERGAWLAPRLLVCGRPITTATGHCNWMGLVAQGNEELCAAARELVEEGVDFIKVMATGGMLTVESDPYSPQYSRDELGVLVAEAHGLGRRVAAHVLSAEGFRRALAAGVDTIEHGWTITGRPQDIDYDLAPEMTRTGAIGSVTAHHALRTLLTDGDITELRRRLAGHRRFRAAGVRLVVHSDAGTPGTRFGDFAESVAVFVHGLDASVTDAVAAATSAAAAALGIEHETGMVAAGLRADLLAVEGDLRDDVWVLRNVKHVIRGGRSLITN